MVWLPLTKMYFVLQNVGKHWRNMLRIHEFNSMYIIHVCLFVCMLFFIPLEDCSLMWKFFCQWGAANLDLSSTIAAIAKWEFFNVRSHLGRDPMTCSICQKFGNGSVFTCFNDLDLFELNVFEFWLKTWYGTYGKRGTLCMFDLNHSSLLFFKTSNS